MSGAKILWVDDEIDLLKPHILFLKGKGYDVETCNNGYDAIDLVAARQFDLVILDEMMPGLTGLETLPRIKELRPMTPVIMVTKSEEENIMDKAVGSKIDDYLIKPFAYPELLARIRALQRRAGKGDFSGTEFSHNGIVLDTVRHTVTRDGKPVNLSPKEYGVLLEIMKADGSYVNAEELFDTVWAGASATDLTDAIKTTVYSLRRKLGEGNGITSTRGKGYRLS